MKHSLLLILSPFVFLACSNAAESDASFRKNWEQNFMNSCIGSDTRPEQGTLCRCMAQRSIKELTTEQLNDPDFAIKHLKEVYLPDCLNQHQVPKAPASAPPTP